MKKKRIVILTDSLGCPRESIGVNDTWTERILQDNQDSVIYTICEYGLSANTDKKTYINYLRPDILICQIGIVDASRRALKNEEKNKLQTHHLLKEIIKRIISKFHFYFTKIRNIHNCDLVEFKQNLEELCMSVREECFFIEIAPPGDALIKKAFNIENDVADYNRVLMDMENEKIHVLHPYSDSKYTSPNEYLQMKDGHHLNNIGEELVYNAVKKAIKLASDEH